MSVISSKPLKISGGSMFKSIRWKFIIIFIMLVLIAITLSGVFIIEFFENNNLKAIDQRLNSLSEIIMQDLSNFNSIDSNNIEVVKSINNKQKLGFTEEIFIISDNEIIASSSRQITTKPEDILDISLLIMGLEGKRQNKILSIPIAGGELRVMDKIFPIINSNQKIIGQLYLRFDLQQNDEILSRIKGIILNAIIIAMTFTIILGIIISNSITGPINAIKKQAVGLAKGNFKNRVKIASNDEIGELSQTFNYMSEQLDLSLNEIQSEKKKLETIVNSVGDGVILINNLYQIVHANTEALHMLNKPEDYPLSFEDIRSFLPYFGNIDELKENASNKIGHITQIGQNYYEVRYENYKSSNKLDEGYVFVYQNVTKRENLEKLRREFVANVSHELKTPITSIQAYSETLIENDMVEGEMGNKFLNVINEEAQRMTRLVNDLLLLSNYDSQNITLDLHPHDWVDMIKRSISKLELMAKEKEQSITFEHEEASLVSMFDLHRMEQVIINLISNAIKYSPEQTPIEIHIKRERDIIVLKIADSGEGIAEEHLPHIFDRFYRVDKGRSRATGGSGLGLSIVKQIVELHHGEISVVSKSNAGTIFTIKIPDNE